MPALPSVPNVVKIIVNGLTGAAIDRVWNNILHASYSGAVPSESILSSIAQQIWNAWVDTGPIVLQTADTSLNSVEVIDLSSDTAASGFYDDGGEPAIGTNGEDPLPAQVCTLISYDQSRRYRGGHPRTYLNAGGDGNLLTMNQWNSGYITDVLSAWGDVMTGLSTASSGGFSLTGMVCVSYVDREVNPVAPYRRTVPLVEPILGFTPDELVATQRRRVGRKGTT